ncbi:MAG: hypothetical protein L0G01_08685, partial [Lactococcus lactis]|nr:hypothetical protein [Lactococcus lactis]
YLIDLLINPNPNVRQTSINVSGIRLFFMKHQQIFFLKQLLISKKYLSKFKKLKPILVQEYLKLNH